MIKRHLLRGFLSILLIVIIIVSYNETLKVREETQPTVKPKSLGSLTARQKEQLALIANTRTEKTYRRPLVGRVR